MKQEVVKQNTRKVVIAGCGYIPGGNSEETVNLPETMDELNSSYTPEQILAYVADGIRDEATSGGRDAKLTELIVNARKMTHAMAAAMPGADANFVTDTFLSLPTPDGSTMKAQLTKYGFVEDRTAGEDDKRINRKSADNADSDEEEEVID